MIVSAVPSSGTPAVNDGEVDAIVQVGDTVVVGGTFSSVTPSGGAAQTRNYIFAFSASTGALLSSFVPALNGPVNDLIAGPATNTVYVGGAFSQVNGAGASHLTLLNATTGAVVGGFKAATTNGAVNTVLYRSGRLYVGGNFTTAGGVAHGGIASMNGTSGALDPYVDNQVSVHHNDSGSGAQGPVGVRDMDINPDGSRIIAIGNFKKVDGVGRDQVVMLTLGATSTTVTPDWNTNRYQPYCFNWAFDTYVRGVSFAPDGSFFVIGATGGQNNGTLCDAAARFETNASGSDIQPTWVDYTGGDTLWGVDVTEKAVYVGGHQRWLNNSQGSDYAGPGAVPRPGIAALDINSGMPLKWNPGRNPRGAAVYALYATPQGLWMGSNTDWVGNYRYRRPKIAFFPLAGGAPEASDAIAGLPATAYLAGRSGQSGTGLMTIPLSSGGAGTGINTTGLIDWTNVRGTFVAGGKLYYGLSNGTFNSRPYSAGTFGSQTTIDPYHDPTWDGVSTGSGNTYDGVLSSYYGELTNVTGAAYAGGRLFYHVSGQSVLYWRWFNTDSGIVGADRFTVSSNINFSNTMGIFVSGNTLYYVTKTDGNLNAIGLNSTATSGTPTTVDGPSSGGNDWRSRVLFLAASAPPNQPPTASFTVDCFELDCTFDASGSTDSDGTISSYSWNFGDGTTGSGQVATHTYGDSGTFSVQLQVTDNDGAIGQATKSADPTAPTPPTATINFVDQSRVAANSATPVITLPATVQAGDLMIMTTTLNSVTTASAPSGWTLLDQASTTGTATYVWTRWATAADAGSARTISLGTSVKSVLTIVAYSGVNTDQPISRYATDSDSSTATHVSPTLTAPSTDTILTFWSDKSPSTSVWTPPPSVSRRVDVYSSGTGRVSALVADSPAPADGHAGGLTATTDVTSTRAITWTIALNPA